MARKLLQDHGLSMMDIEVGEDCDGSLSGFVDMDLDDRKTLPVWVKTIVGVLGMYFDIGAATLNREGRHLITFYGNKVNAQAAAGILPGLVHQVSNLVTNYHTWKTKHFKDKSYTRRIRDSYRMGLLKGFIDRLQDEKVREAFYEESDKTALAIYNEDLAKDVADKEGWHISSEEVKLKPVEEQSFLDGKQDSNKLSLRKGLER